MGYLRLPAHSRQLTAAPGDTEPMVEGPEWEPPGEPKPNLRKTTQKTSRETLLVSPSHRAVRINNKLLFYATKLGGGITAARGNWNIPHQNDQSDLEYISKNLKPTENISHWRIRSTGSTNTQRQGQAGQTYMATLDFLSLGYKKKGMLHPHLWECCWS